MLVFAIVGTVSTILLMLGAILFSIIRNKKNADPPVPAETASGKALDVGTLAKYFYAIREHCKSVDANDAVKQLDSVSPYLFHSQSEDENSDKQPEKK